MTLDLFVYFMPVMLPARRECLSSRDSRTRAGKWVLAECSESAASIHHHRFLLFANLHSANIINCTYQPIVTCRPYHLSLHDLVYTRNLDIISAQRSQPHVPALARIRNHVLPPQLDTNPFLPVRLPSTTTHSLY